MKYIIMADGKGNRWEHYMGIPKHFIKFGGETLLERTVRLLKANDPGCEVIITSHDPRYEVEGATRYEPKNNLLEVDRFTEELIENEICFLYGDTFYSEHAVRCIMTMPTEDVLFFGNEKSIVAIKIQNADVFYQHFMHVRTLFLEGKIKDCKGWQVYQSYAGLPFDHKQIAQSYIYIEDETIDFNTPEEFEINRR